MQDQGAGGDAVRTIGHAGQRGAGVRVCKCRKARGSGRIGAPEGGGVILPILPEGNSDRLAA